MKANIIYVLMLCLCFASCSTMRKATATSEAVETCVKQYPTVADLDVKAKVEKTVTWNWTLFRWGQPDMATRKGNLIADIVKENSADVLLEPQVTYTKVPFGKRTLTISGFPASFKDFRQATDTDLKALEISGAFKRGAASGNDSDGEGFFSKIVSKFK